MKPCREWRFPWRLGRLRDSLSEVGATPGKMALRLRVSRRRVTPSVMPERAALFFEISQPMILLIGISWWLSRGETRLA